MLVSSCELCAVPGGTVLWESEKLRIVRVDDPDYPGFCRVIWHEHVREMSDLEPVDRQTVMKTVMVVETVVRALFQPDKINLASLGNMTPHVHWHIIPRWTDDRHFPQPVWATPQRTDTPPRAPVDDARLAAALATALGPTLNRAA